VAAEQGKRETEAGLYASRVSNAYQAWEKGDVKEAEDLLGSCPTVLRDWEWRYLKRQCHTELTSFSVLTTGDTGTPEAARSFDSLFAGGHIMEFYAQLAFLADDLRLGVKLGELGRNHLAVFDLSTGKPVP